MHHMQEPQRARLKRTLQEMVSGYNASPHKGVGMAHIEINNSNQLKIWKKYYSQGVNHKPFILEIT